MQVIQTKEPTQESLEVQSLVSKNNSVVIAQTKKSAYCHWCSPQKEPETPILFMHKGRELKFCDENELNQWKLQYNID